LPQLVSRGLIFKGGGSHLFEDVCFPLQCIRPHRVWFWRFPIGLAAGKELVPFRADAEAMFPCVIGIGACIIPNLAYLLFDPRDGGVNGCPIVRLVRGH
jgi:hypothetical protein